MSMKRKVLLGALLHFAVAILVGVVFGNEGKNDAFKPQNEFKLDPWISIKVGSVDMSINKAVLYLVLASGLTIVTMTWIARRMQQRPNRVQTAAETMFNLTRKNIAEGNMDAEYATKWFPFVATLFFFIWFSNLIGFLPLPTNTEETINIFGVEVPALSLYAATANISIPLVLTIVVWFGYHVQGIRQKGLIPYFRSWLPPGLGDLNPAFKAFIFVIEVISHLARLISLSVRLFANILAGHLLILFMAGGLAVLLGLAALGVLTFPLVFFFFILEVGLIATLQAFIFATLTAIYVGGATAESH